MMLERTLVLVKPDGVARGYIGEVIRRFERRGWALVALKMLVMDRSMAEEHYAEHSGKAFFEELVEFITSGPLVAMVVEGPGAVAAVRLMMGATNPVEAAPGTIRGDLAAEMGTNVVHGSDSATSAEREIGIFFPEL